MKSVVAILVNGLECRVVKYQYGQVTDVNKFAIQALDAFLNDPIYAFMSLKTAKIQVDAILRGDYLCQLSADGRVHSFLVFSRITEEVARFCITHSRMPSVKQLDSQGDAVFINVITGHDTKHLIKEFIRMFNGHKILYCRHVKRGQSIAESKVVFINESGRLMGTKLEKSV